jgi:glutamine synthetase adenylyltransferase
MSPWERVAFAKCVAWGGDATLAGEFFELVRRFVTARIPRKEVLALADVRRRLEGLAMGAGSELETKRSAGGRYDIEYLCAIALAASGERYALDAGTAARLDMVASTGRVSSGDFHIMRDTLSLYRRIDWLLELQGWTLPKTRERVEAVTRYLDCTLDLMGTPAVSGVSEAVLRGKKTIRAGYEGLLADLS